MTEQRPPVDFDAQKAADRIAELIAEGSVLARGWVERFARRREDGAPSSPASTDPAPREQEPMDAEDPWSQACDDATAGDLPAADGHGSAHKLADEAATNAATANGVDPRDTDVVADPANDVDALMAALRVTAARRLGVPPGRIRVTVVLDDTDTVVLDDTAVVLDDTDAVVASSPMADGERDPVEALTAALDDLAARARTRLSEELGVRLPDIIAEIRFPAGGRPSVRIRPSARGGSRAAAAAGSTDIEGIVRRLLLGRDTR